MKKASLIIAGSLVAALANAAQAQDATTTYGPIHFGVSSNAPNTSPFGSKFGMPDQSNPIYQSPLRDRASVADTTAAPSLGQEGGGTPMSRGGVNDTLTGAQRGVFGPAPTATPGKSTAKQAGKSAEINGHVGTPSKP